MDSLDKQQAEKDDFVNVLKDQVATREQQSSMIQADVSLGRKNRAKLRQIATRWDKSGAS